MSGAKRHTHKYHFISGVWACGLPDCTHYMPSNMIDMMDNRNSICWNCGQTMQMDKLRLLMTKPICKECNNGD